MSGGIRVERADPRHPPIAALLALHLRESAAASPEESCHALGIEALCAPEVRFFAAWDGDALAGCGALQRIGAEAGELKSMRTAPAFLRLGVASAMLAALVREARAAAMRHLYLETGSMAQYAAARAFYARHGFIECPPFGDYVEDPHSVFLHRMV